MNTAAFTSLVRPQYSPMQTPRFLLRMLMVTLCLCLAQPFSAAAQTSAPSLLPPAAQEALNKGIIAAKVPDYLLAIRYFEQARKAAPQAPVIYMNLGLAESNIPGRELRAIAWFGAYLAAYPDAPNAAAVKEQIGTLEVMNQSNVLRLIKSAQDAAGQLSGDAQSSGLYWVAMLWLDTGDMAAALKLANLIQDPLDKGNAFIKIVIAQAESGDVVSAKKTTDQIQAPQFKSDALLNIANAKIKSGDLEGAKQTLISALKSADLIDVPTSIFYSVAYQSAFFVKSQTQLRIAESQIKAGDIEGAQGTLASAIKTSDRLKGISEKKMVQSAISEIQAKSGDIVGALKAADLVQDATWKSSAQAAIAAIQTKNGDIAGARNTFLQAHKTADLSHDESQKSQALSYIAEFQARSGDTSSAEKTADLIHNAFFKSLAQNLIAEVQAKKGDITGAQTFFVEAQKTADLVTDAISKSLAQRIIAETRAIAFITNAAVSDWLKKLDDDNKDSVCPLNTEPFLDLTGYLKSLPKSDNPQTVFNVLRETAKTIVSAQNVITGMLKQGARK